MVKAFPLRKDWGSENYIYRVSWGQNSIWQYLLLIQFIEKHAGDRCCCDLNTILWVRVGRTADLRLSIAVLPSQRKFGHCAIVGFRSVLNQAISRKMGLKTNVTLIVVVWKLWCFKRNKGIMSSITRGWHGEPWIILEFFFLSLKGVVHTISPLKGGYRYQISAESHFYCFDISRGSPLKGCLVLRDAKWKWWGNRAGSGDLKIRWFNRGGAF